MLAKHFISKLAKYKGGVAARRSMGAIADCLLEVGGN